MIYTRFYTPVKLLTCESVNEQGADGVWYPVNYVTAEQSAPHPRDGSGHVGRPILDGQQFPASELCADEGWGEISGELDRLKLERPEPSDPAREAYDPVKHERQLRWVTG